MISWKCPQCHQVIWTIPGVKYVICGRCRKYMVREETPAKSVDERSDYA